MIKKKAQTFAVKGFALLVVFFLIMMVLFALIEPFKESLDDARDGVTVLNCPGTLNFNDTNFTSQGSLEKLTKRPTCWVTGIYMVYFIFSVMIASLVWVVVNWSKK